MKKLILSFFVLVSCTSIAGMEQAEKSIIDHIGQFELFCNDSNFDEAALYYAQNLCNAENLTESQGYEALILQIHGLIKNQNGQALSSLICFVDGTDSLYQLANQVINDNLGKNQSLGIIPELQKQSGFMTLAEQDKEVDTALGKYIYEESLENLASLLVLQKKYKENPTQSPKIKEALKKLPLFSICLLDDNNVKIDLSPEQFCSLYTASKTIQELIADQHVDFKATKYELSLLNITHEQFSLLCPLLDIIVNKKFLCDQSIESLFLENLKPFELKKLLVLYGLAEYLDIDPLQHSCSQLVSNIVLQKDELVKFIKNPIEFLKLFRFSSLHRLITEKIIQTKQADIIKKIDLPTSIFANIDSMYFALELSPCNQLLAVVQEETSDINYYEINEDNKPKRIDKQVNFGPRVITFSPCGNFLASGWGDGLRIYKKEKINKKLNFTRIFEKSGGCVKDVAFSSDVTKIAVIANKGIAGDCIEIYSIDQENFTLKHTFTDHTSGILSITFSPDGKLFASSGQDCRIALYNIAADGSFNLKKKITTPNKNIKFGSFIFSPDSKLLVTDIGPFYYDCSKMNGDVLSTINIKEVSNVTNLGFYSNNLLIVGTVRSIHFIKVCEGNFELIKTINIGYCNSLTLTQSGQIAWGGRDYVAFFKLAQPKNLGQALLCAALLEDLSIDLTNEELKKIFDSLEEPLKKLKK